MFDKKDKCEFCGSTENVQYKADPYDEDLYGIDKKRYICKVCEREHANDI